MKLPILLVIVSFLLLLILLLLLNLFLDSTWTGLVFGIVSLICGTIVSLLPNEIRDLLSKLFLQYSDSGFGKALNKLKSVFSKFIYPDLILLILSLMLLAFYFSTSIENSLTELINQNYIAFPDQNGLYHLKLYMIGNITFPLFLGTLGFYGFLCGFQLRKSLLKFFTSSIIGMMLSIISTSIIKGGWTGIIEIKRAEANNNVQLPDTEYVRLFLFVGLLIFFALSIAIYVWILAVSVGFLKNRITALMSEANTKQNINNATREILMEKMDIPSTVADEILLLKKSITLDNLIEVKGVGNKTLEKAKQSFYFNEE